MMPVTFYGIYCSEKDEKAITQRVNDYLSKFQRKLSKSKQPILLKKFEPFVLKHFYWRSMNDVGTWFDIYPNADVTGNYFFPKHKDCAWILHVQVNLYNYPMASTLKAQQFVSGLLAAVGFKTVILGQRVVNFAVGPRESRRCSMSNDGEANGPITESWDEAGV
jgi:hypothetical protein